MIPQPEPLLRLDPEGNASLTHTGWSFIDAFAILGGADLEQVARSTGWALIDMMVLRAVAELSRPWPARG